MEHLESIGADVCIAYLEHIIHHLDEEGAEFSEKLIELYLDASRVSTIRETSSFLVSRGTNTL